MEPFITKSERPQIGATPDADLLGPCGTAVGGDKDTKEGGKEGKDKERRDIIDPVTLAAGGGFA